MQKKSLIEDIRDLQIQADILNKCAGQLRDAGKKLKESATIWKNEKESKEINMSGSIRSDMFKLI